MIISSITQVHTQDIARYAWAELRKFHNTRYTFDIHTDLLNVPAKYKKFAEKQAEHIRYSLLQAKEYATAAQTATLATRPVLLYYCCMSLALAEILMKQGGESSLDKAREEHNYHGLSLHADEQKLRKHYDFRDIASALKAVPLIKGGGVRAGTFELWHRSARGTPIVGKHIETHANGTVLQHYKILMHPADEAYSEIEKSGINLLDCLSNVPEMSSILTHYGVNSTFIRGRVEADENFMTNTSKISTIIHPTLGAATDDFLESGRKG